MTWAARCLVVAELAGCGRVGFEPLDGRGGNGDGNGSAAGDAAPSDSDGTPPADARIDAASIGCGTDPNCSSSSFALNAGSSGSANGSTAFFTDGTQGSCGTSGGGDYGARFMVMASGMYRFTLTAAFDTLLYVLDGPDCSAPERTCADNPGVSGEEVVLSLTAGTSIVVIVDSNSGCGNFSLDYQAE